MAGLALYGDVGAAIVSGGPIHLRHRLESVKIMQLPGTNPPHLWGALTATATSTVEIQAPTRRRAFGMAVSAEREVAGDAEAERIMLGQPTSWSAAVDALAAGLGIDVTEDGMVFLDEEEERERRLFLLAAGNVESDAWQDAYLDRSDVEPVEDPGQAWNALTIGAYTEAVTFDDHEPGYEGWTPLAPNGELSPHSRTSVPFHRQWPAKPDVVLEGGNVARSPNGSTFDTPYAFQTLTTKAPVNDARLLTVTCATSAATARGTHVAASILAEYPSLWPETVRALVVHSAEWTKAMRARFDAERTRQGRVALFRRYGMGVPDLARATRSATDALTLIAEDVIRPFDGQGRRREMTIHDLPWLTDVLDDLGGIPVSLRITLSYFVDPNPPAEDGSGVTATHRTGFASMFAVRRSRTMIFANASTSSLLPKRSTVPRPTVTQPSGTSDPSSGCLARCIPTSGMAPPPTWRNGAPSQSSRSRGGGRRGRIATGARQALATA